MNIHFFSIILDYIQTGAVQGGYAFLFIISILESLPLVGTTVPGHITVILSGFLAKLGILNIYYVITIAALGAFFGDVIAFYLGRKYGMSLIERFRKYFFIKDEHIAKANKLLESHTGKALIIGRFSPITRSIMPFLIGNSGTGQYRFLGFTLVSGILWSTISVLLGFVFGYGYHIAALYFGRIVMFTILLAIIIIWGYRFINSRFHIFRKYELIILVLNLISLWILAKTIQDAVSVKSFMANFDIWVNVYVAEKVGHTLSVLGNLVSTLGSTAVTGILGVLIGLYLAYKKKWRSATIMAFSVITSGIFIELMKAVFMRERPVNALVHIVNDPSFPSGHAGMASAFFLALMYVFAPKFSALIRREVFLVLCIVATIAIGLSRIVLNVHWASDVVAGWSLGIFATSSVILLVRYVGALLIKKEEKNV